MNLNKITKHLPLVAAVIVGVIGAGWVMNSTRGSFSFVDDASNGFQGL